MRASGLKPPPAALGLALGLLVGVAPVLALAQEPPAAQSQPGAVPQTDAASDPASAAPEAEPRIDAPFGHAWLGAADGDVTLVVFADYACPACREAQPVIDQLLAQDSKLKVVYRLLDNDQGGRTAALTSLAVARQSADWGKFHRALDVADEVSAKTIAAAVAASGVDPAKLPSLKDDDPETLPLDDELVRNDNLITERKGTALPSWLIGDGPAQNGFDLAGLQAAIAKARADGKR
jgi:protein-disulfide isomerase